MHGLGPPIYALWVSPCVFLGAHRGESGCDLSTSGGLKAARRPEGGGLAALAVVLIMLLFPNVTVLAPLHSY